MADRIQVDPEMTPETLENILKCLPKPTFVDVGLSGNFDYSGISRQADAVVKGVALYSNGPVVFQLDKPSKQKVQDIYRRNVASEDADQRICLLEVEWYFKNHTHVTLTPVAVDVSYQNKQPRYLTKIRKALEGTGIPLTVRIESQ
ncbi:hypothetical protein HZB02_06015 [Candidatus Woesearchaeota archaeon]|nr:hypothetical protein [Candidatus Woesearchaeota archaeon]